MESAKSISSGLGGLSQVAKAKHLKVSRPVPYILVVSKILFIIAEVMGTLVFPIRTWLHLSNTPSGAPCKIRKLLIFGPRDEIRLKDELQSYKISKFFNQNQDLTLTNIFGPDPKRETLVGMQYELMDFLSLENSRVNSFFHMLWIPWLTTKAASRRDLPVLSKFHGFSFSASTVKAVSVASPTFSKHCLYCLRKNKKQSMRIVHDGHSNYAMFL